MKLFPVEVTALIRTRAYLRFLDRMDRGIPGSALSDWDEAQKSIMGGVWPIYDSTRGSMYATN